MSVESKLTIIDTSLSNIKTAITNKGVTPSGDITTYATAIGNISALNGTTLNVTPTTSAQNLTPTSPYNGYTTVNVSAVTSSIDSNIVAGNIKDGVTILNVTGNYQGSGGSTRFGISLDNYIGQVNNGVLGAPSDINGITFTGVTEIGSGALSELWQHNIYGIPTRVYGTVSFPDLITVRDGGMDSTFRNNEYITAVNLSSLTTVEDFGMSAAFEGNQISGNLDLSSLTTVGDGGLIDAFNGNLITSVDLSSLTTIEDQGMSLTFYGNRITSITFTSLTDIGSMGLSGILSEQSDSQGNPCLTDIYFPALTTNSQIQDDSFESMLEGNDGVTVHFPSNLESVIGEWESVLSGFGGENTTVLFDLPSTDISHAGEGEYGGQL